jgi:hypothetical protein
VHSCSRGVPLLNLCTKPYPWASSLNLMVLSWFVCRCFVICSVQVFSFLSIIFVYFLVLRHETMDKVHKQNSINTNTSSSESYRSDFCSVLQAFCFNSLVIRSRGSSVSIVTGLRDGWPVFNFRYGQWKYSFSFRHRVHTGSGAHPPSYPVDTGVSIPKGKATGAWSWQVTSTSCRG